MGERVWDLVTHKWPYPQTLNSCVNEVAVVLHSLIHTSAQGSGFKVEGLGHALHRCTGAECAEQQAGTQASQHDKPKQQQCVFVRVRGGSSGFDTDTNAGAVVVGQVGGLSGPSKCGQQGIRWLH